MRKRRDNRVATNDSIVFDENAVFNNTEPSDIAIFAYSDMRADRRSLDNRIFAYFSIVSDFHRKVLELAFEYPVWRFKQRVLCKHTVPTYRKRGLFGKGLTPLQITSHHTALLDYRLLVNLSYL
ncbi:hypothetical protein AYI70_g2314 [Smittium culicis]|uniref:Uncharacterized protein n=1 Tax=Smittium culicis TaxID=133412 RepID=A0A1R1Y8W4_9FUNG|nr:hypothetical protein AYI70_g2314 [Smittium culicis]